LDKHRWPAEQVPALHWHTPLVVHVPAEPAAHCALAVHLHTDVAQENPGGQACPQAPQLPALLVRSMQPAGFSQHVWPMPHAAPPLQEQTSVVVWMHTSPNLQVPVPQEHTPLDLQVPAAPAVLHCAVVVQPHVAGAFALGSHTKWLPAAPWTAQEFAQLPHEVVSAMTLVSQPSSGAGAAGVPQFA
jgi:hypothetical protein